jgi:Tol biopolymer transport system component
MPEKYDPNKYNAPVYNVTGGSKQDRANIDGITYKADNGIIDIQLHFVSGSIVEGEVVSCGIPEYKVEFLPSPLRLTVTLKDMTYWDYMVSGVPKDELGVVSGMFQMSPSEISNETVLYFNLSKAVNFKVIEAQDTLTVSLALDSTKAPETKWYLVSDLYYEYQTGEKTDYGFTPMLCDDNISVIMISEGFVTEAEALKKKEELTLDVLKGSDVRVVTLTDGSLPRYAENTDTQALLSESVLSVDGAKTTLPLFFADARFLTWAPDKTNALFAKNEDGIEKLYTADMAGTKHLLTETGFMAVTNATYSLDGSKLVFIEQAFEEALITVVDVKTGNISVVNDEENPWGTIMGVRLNEDGSKMYVMCGNETYSIKVYDFATATVSVLANNILVESDIVYSNGYLYYSDVYEEYEAIVRRSVDGGEAEFVHKGAQFALSPDGTKLAAIVEHYETAVCDLRVVDLVTGTWATVTEDIVTSDFFFSDDGKTLFYIIETGDQEFYYQIMEYNVQEGTVNGLAQCVNSVFYASVDPREIIISVIYTDESGARHVTYIADFDKMITGEASVTE